MILNTNLKPSLLKHGGFSHVSSRQLVNILFTSALKGGKKLDIVLN